MEFTLSGDLRAPQSPPVELASRAVGKGESTGGREVSVGTGLPENGAAGPRARGRRSCPPALGCGRGNALSKRTHNGQDPVKVAFGQIQLSISHMPGPSSCLSTEPQPQSWAGSTG